MCGKAILKQTQKLQCNRCRLVLVQNGFQKTKGGEERERKRECYLQHIHPASSWWHPILLWCCHWDQVHRRHLEENQKQNYNVKTVKNNRSLPWCSRKGWNESHIWFNNIENEKFLRSSTFCRLCNKLNMVVYSVQTLKS